MTHVAMEATGVDWISIFDILDARGFFRLGAMNRGGTQTALGGRWPGASPALARRRSATHSAA